MKIKTSQMLWGAVALIALSQGENVRQSLYKNDQARQEQSVFNDRLRQNRTEARQAQKLSQVALDRYKANCILVIDQKSKQQTYFREGAVVIDPGMKRPIRANAFICNKLGDTAVVDATGAITDIARVSTSDLAEFKTLLEARK